MNRSITIANWVALLFLSDVDGGSVRGSPDHCPGVKVVIRVEAKRTESRSWLAP